MSVEEREMEQAVCGDSRRQAEQVRRAACPVCGGELIEIRAKLQCARCHTICETCCEGGRG